MSKGFNSLVKTLTVGSSSNGALNFIGGLWDSAVSLAQGAISNLATEDATNTQTTLNSQHTATLNYATNTETTAQAAGGLITNDYVLVTGRVSIDKQELADLIKDVVLGNVPGAVRVVVGPLVDSLTSALARQIAGLAEPEFSHYVQIEHHGTPCLVGNWTITSVNDGEGPGAGATIDWGSDDVVADYDGSGPAPNGGYVTGTESATYTLAATNGSGAAGTFNETPLSGGLTYHDGTAETFIAEDPLSGQWTCSGSTSTITEERANGTDTWTEQRQTP